MEGTLSGSVEIANETTLEFKRFTISLGKKSNDEQFGAIRAGFGQVFLAENYDLLLKKIRGGDVVIDAGANIGIFTIRAARIVDDSSSVIAVEPQRDNIGFLEENIRLNKLSNFKIIDRALYPNDDKNVHFGGRVRRDI